jgi:hypothetical protein
MNKLLLKLVMSMLLLSQKNVKSQSKYNFINDDHISIDNETRFMEQAFNKTYP